MKVNLVCLKWGQRYSSQYVNELFRGICGNLSLPFEMTCFADEPRGIDSAVTVRDIRELYAHDRMVRTAYTKYSVLHSSIGLQGPTLFCDLDLIIMNSLDDLFAWNPGRFCIIHNWIAWRKTIFRRRPHIGNSSVFRFDAGTTAYDHVLESFLEDPVRVRNSFSTEQAFLSHCLSDELLFWPAEWIRSFKSDCTWSFPLNCLCKPTIPADTKILVFHGRPDPHEAIVGFHSGLRKRTIAVPELARFWNPDAPLPAAQNTEFFDPTLIRSRAPRSAAGNSENAAPQSAERPDPRTTCSIEHTIPGTSGL